MDQIRIITNDDKLFAKPTPLLYVKPTGLLSTRKPTANAEEFVRLGVTASEQAFLERHAN